MDALARHGVHLHFYGDFIHGQWREWIAKAGALAPRHLHLHANVAQDRWVEAFSRYDAGWLHCFASRNAGEPARADSDDLNYPARIATLAMAGLPMIQRDNVWRQRERFAFDTHVPALLGFFRDVIAQADAQRPCSRSARG